MKGLFWKDPKKKQEIKEIKEVENTTPSVKKQPTSIDNDPDFNLNMDALSNTNTKSTIQTTNLSGTADDESREYFKKIYAERNQPGPDFQEFSNAELSLRSKAMPEQMRFEAAAAGIFASGVTKQHLIDTGNGYINDADGKLNGFKTALEKTHADTVGKMQNEHDQLEKENLDIEAEMVKLNDRKNKNMEKMQSLHTEMDSTNAKLTAKAANFEAAYKEHVTFIKETITKIEQYL